jgi:hypothetical protein
MKISSKTEAKQLAKAYSHNKEYENLAVYIIYCNRTKSYYVDTNSLIRNWEQIIGYYTNGVFTSNNNN